MRVTGRLTELDMERDLSASKYARPMSHGGAFIPEDKLEFYEWLNHNGLSKKAYRVLHVGVRRHLTRLYEEYILGKREELCDVVDKEHNFREWLSMAPYNCTLDELFDKDSSEQMSLLTEYLGNIT